MDKIELYEHDIGEYVPNTAICFSSTAGCLRYWLLYWGKTDISPIKAMCEINLMKIGLRNEVDYRFYNSTENDELLIATNNIDVFESIKKSNIFVIRKEIL